MSQMFKDYVAFVDGGSVVPYFVDGAKYTIKPNVYSEYFEYGMKEFYKSFNNYYVGIGSSKFVRPIHAGDFKRVKELYLARGQESIVGKNIQLCFKF